MTLKEYFLKTNKLIIYKFYAQFFAKPLKYDNITRKEMYHQIINLYKKNPLIIINLCSMEEISILKSIISENNIRHTGYIEYLCYQNLLNNFLLMEDKKELFIPTDIINYIKMALNLFDELTYSNQDIEISALIGLSRIYNCLPVNDLIPILAKYHITINNLKDYINKNIILKKRVEIVKYQKEDYFISKEYLYYKDIIKLQNHNQSYFLYTLEEVISFGKYKINLFCPEILEYLSFLEIHLEDKYIEALLHDLIIYMGFDLNNIVILNKITDNIKELLEETNKVLPYFPIWVLKGHNLINKI